MAANYEFALIGETEVTNNTSYTMQLNFTYGDFAEFFVTAKLRAYATTTGNHSIDIGQTDSSNAIPAINNMYAGGYYGGQISSGTGSVSWWGGTSNSAFRPFRTTDSHSAYGSGRWTVCHWQLANQPNQSQYWPWVGQTISPQTDGRIGVWGAAQASNNTYGSSHGGIYIRCSDYPFASGSKLTVWGHGHV